MLRQRVERVLAAASSFPIAPQSCHASLSTFTLRPVQQPASGVCLAEWRPAQRKFCSGYGSTRKVASIASTSTRVVVHVIDRCPCCHTATLLSTRRKRLGRGYVVLASAAALISLLFISSCFCSSLRQHQRCSLSTRSLIISPHCRRLAFTGCPTTSSRQTSHVR